MPLSSPSLSAPQLVALQSLPPQDTEDTLDNLNAGALGALESDAMLTYAAFKPPGIFIRSAEHAKSLPRAQNHARRLFISGPKFKSLHKTNEQKLQSTEQEEKKSGYHHVRTMIFDRARRLATMRVESRFLNFLSIVDLDDGSFRNQVVKDLVGRFVESNIFRFGILFIILANAIFIGIQTDQVLSAKYGKTFTVVDYVFQGMFVVEILIKWYLDFTGYWKSGWNLFDFSLVASTLLGPSLTFLGSARVLRVLRVFRAFRALRSITIFSGLQVIISTVIQSIPDMANIIMLLLIVMYIFAVVGVTLFAEYLPDSFGDLGGAFFVLFVCLTQDGWYDYYYALYQKGQFIMPAIYFAGFIVIGALVFINLIVAVVVSNLTNAYEDLAKQKQLKNRELRTNAEFMQGVHQRPTVNISDINSKTFTSQVPFEIPDLTKLSPSKLDNYLLILSIMEENMRIYVDLKEDLLDVLSELKGMDQNAEDDSLIGSEDSSDDEVREGPSAGGDIMSQLIKAQQGGLGL